MHSQSWQLSTLSIVHGPEHKVFCRNVKQSSNFQTSVLKLELEFDLRTFGIRTSGWNLSTIVT